tara:strand:+ start:27971 stop:28129 length:159 start_codon:yes stop_codon:yes gene_type:complete
LEKNTDDAGANTGFLEVVLLTLTIKSLEENFREFPLLPGIEERIKACIIGVN